MEAQFWHQRWEENNTFWHQSEANPRLTANFNRLSVVKGGRIFLPLCGKTLDIPWLLSRGYRVAGAELSKIAIEQLFAGLGVKPEISAPGKLDHYSAKNVEIYGGDIFDLSEKTLGRVDAIYDRAALVALPSTMRERYTAHLREITGNAPQLLVCWEYDQSLMESKDVPGGLKGKCAATENVWLLKND
jgi:thiopurine S-methyltransferase